MEHWEALVEACPSPPDIKHFNKLVQSAGILLLKEDVAQFEIEWIVQTILFKPVHLISIVTNKRNDDAWSKAIGDAFKLLTEVTKKHPESLQPYYDDIVTLCLLPYDTVTKKQALACASEIAKVSPAGARDAHRHISSLEEMSTCRAALIALVGTICEYHPEVVSEDFNKIWRIFLNLLDSNKNTDTIISALLQGILSLFKHFGSDLPMSELNSFYDQLTRDCIGVARCEDVILSILAEYASLFRERISRDNKTRAFVWNCLQENHKARAAVESVYRAVCNVVDCKTLQNIITSEIIPHTDSYRTQVKYTALRILSYIRTKVPGVRIEIPDVDLQALECELRTQVVSYETAEAIAWCIESNLPDCDVLLHTAISFYTNIPVAKRKEIVVYGILKAPDELRTSAINFLISESTISEASLTQYLPLWRDLFNSNGGTDAIVVENCRRVVDDVTACVGFVLRTFLDERAEECLEVSLTQYLPLWRNLFNSNGGTDAIVAENCRRVVDDVTACVGFVLRTFLEERAEKIPDKLTNLLTLTHQILTLQSPEEFPAEYFDTLLRLIKELVEVYGADSASVAVARVIGGGEICKMIPIDRCKDEALLCEACLAIIQSDIDDVDNLLMALQIMFSRSDVEPKTLSQALKRFETLLNTNKTILENKCTSQILNLIQRLRDRKDLVGKDARILHRDVLMFLGKHGTRTDLNNYLNTSESTLVVKLKDTLTLNLPNYIEGSSYKINLQEILQLALINEDAKLLQTLLSIICANLSTRPDPNLRLALFRVVACLARCHSRGDEINPSIIENAMMFCDDIACVTEVLKYISEEKSPGVRKMLSDALEGLLMKPENDALVSAVAERAIVLCLATIPTVKRAGLDITQTLVSALKENNLLSKNLLPNILVTVSKTFEIDSETTFRLASEVFFEKFQLFDEDSLKNLVKELFVVLLDSKFEINGEITWKAYKNTVKVTIDFTSKVFGHIKEDMSKITEAFFECNEKQNGVELQKSLYVLAEMRRIFHIDLNSSREILCYKNCEVLNMLLDSEFKYSMENCMCLEAILNFMQEYADVLLELKYKETLEYTAKTMVNLSPAHVKYLQKTLEGFMTVFINKLKNIPQILKSSLQEWCQTLPLNEITESMSKHYFDASHAVILYSLKVMLDIYSLTDLSVLTIVSVNAKKWPTILLRIFANEFSKEILKMKLLHVTDAMTVAVKFLTVTDVKKILLEGIDIDGVANEKIGLKFCRFFMHVFCEVLVRKPFLLLDEDMKSCCIIVNDLVKYVLKMKMSAQVYDNVLELVDKIWPTYAIKTTFNQKHSLLLDMSALPKKLRRESNPIQWVVDFIASDSSVGEKARLIGVLPGGVEYSQCYRSFASLLPTRLSEMRGVAQASFRAILDALAVNRDGQLLEIVTALAGGDDTKGWWDESINTCMAAISSSDNTELCKAAYARCFDGLSLGVCERVLVPLLRHSSPQTCEAFYSTTIQELLQKLYSFKPMSSTHYKYQESVANVTRVLILLRVAFEKVPSTSIESPSSLLYREVQTEQSWYLVRKVCLACATLSELKCPDNADDQFRKNVRLFHCANYNCLTTAICLRKREAKPYRAIFGSKVWANLIDPDVKYQLRLRNSWSNRTKRQPTSIATDSEHLNPQTMTSSSTLTSRTKLFLRTLSDNPMRYDLFYSEESEDTMAPLELQLDDNELNNHECASTLTSLFCHVASLSHTEWRDTTVNTLKASGVKYEVKCLIAQTIINCKEELKTHASAFRPALLAFIADTVSVENERRLLNRLHVDIIEILLQWGDPSPEPSTHLDAVFFALINTCLENRQRKNIYNSLAAILDKMLEVYHSVVRVEWQVFEPNFKDTSKEALKTLQILTRITKHKIHIPELLPKLISMFEKNEYFGQLPKLSELFGLAMDCRLDYSILARFKKVLEHSRRNNGGEYVKMLYYAQQGCKRICDEHNFKTTIDLLPKIIGAEKPKCLHILASYIQTHPQESCVEEMFRTIDISELLSQDNPVEAMGLLEGGFKGLEEGVRRRVIMQVGGLCGHANEKTRRAAFEVMLRAFEDLFETPQESSSKRPKTTIRTPITDSIDNKDIFTATVLSCVGYGFIDRSEGVRSMVLEAVKGFLYGDCMGVRFTECFILTIYYPLTYKNTNNKNVDASVCLSALLESLLIGLKDDQRFQNVLLRDEPLGMSRQPSLVPSRLLTLSRTYQGTFRSRNLTTRRSNTKSQTATDLDIDVQIPLKTILENLLQFAKQTPEAASALCLQLLKSLPKQPNFELGPTLVNQLTLALSERMNDLTPFIVELCRMFVDDCSAVDGFKSAIENLKTYTKGTEGEFHTKLLYEELYLCTGDRDMFVLGLYEEVDDVKMEEELRFCMEDLVSVFGKLSNWDDLTVRQRRSIRNEGLPPLWADKDTFRACLDGYAGEGWFAKLLSAYRNEKDECMKWLREADKWPRRPFYMSAITEALQWLYTSEDEKTFPCEIHPSDCLAEWSARLMIRAAHLNPLNSDSEEQPANNKLSRSHELVWCERANEMEIPSAVMDCVKRNMDDLHRSETLPWLRQKVLALRSMGLQRRDNSILKKALTSAETYTPAPEFNKYSSPETIIAMNRLILQLNQDLKSLSTAKINQIIEEVHEQNARSNAQTNVHSLRSIYEIVMTFYDEQFDTCTDEIPKENVVANMTSLLQQIVELNIPHAEMFLDVILNRFDDCHFVREDASKILLDTIQQIFPKLDEFSVHQLRLHVARFPSRLLPRYPYLNECIEDRTLDRFKQCFELINDAEYLLMQYCDLLMKASVKQDKNNFNWAEIFDRMRYKIFENPYAGTDYQLLIKYKDKLYEIEIWDKKPSFKIRAQSILKEVIRELRLRKRQDILRLTQMCPTLGSNLVSDPCVGKLLGLPSGVYVVKFYEQVPVFADSIRRPAVLRALLSDGTTRRYLHKSGESLQTDAAVQRIQSVVDKVFGANVVSYKVTPLSDDCGLIEFLEDYERIRSLISKTCDLDTILDKVPRPVDHELILSPAAVSLHRQLCDKAPAKSLRSSIQLHSASTQDFIRKKHRFQETLASMTILNWVLGVGDRHLQNIMYSTQDGAVCGVDFASCLQFSGGGAEVPPARLTNNFLAVCDVTILESRLQKLLGDLRHSHRMFLPAIRISFRWMRSEFDEKFKHITSILSGKSLPYHISRHSIEHSDQYTYKNKYIELLNTMFSEYDGKDFYSVEEQISCLLRQCTEPQVLSVTRSGWEPWV